MGGAIDFFFFNLLRQSYIFETFGKAKKATLSKGEPWLGSPFCPTANAFSGVSGKGTPPPWLGAGQELAQTPPGLGPREMELGPEIPKETR